MKDMMLKLYVKMQSMLASEEGQDLVEYALLAALLSLAAVAFLGDVSSAINDTFKNVAAELTTAGTPAGQ